MKTTRTVSITKDGWTRTLELTNHSKAQADYAIAEWLLKIGYKPPSRWSLFTPKELKGFSKETLEVMRKIAQ